MKNELVSIIVPVYNAEQYLDRCLESIINQTYKNLEIIIVNDGSTDNSLLICNKYEKKDKRIKILNKENVGVSSARNFGLSKITGNYVCFIDSDDFISNKYIETLLSNILKTNSDISVCSYKRFSDIGQIDNDSLSKDYSILNRTEAYKEMIGNSNFSGYVWNRLYKIDIIKKLKNNLFEEYMIEDFEFNSRIFNYCERIVYTNNILYYYFINNNGITGSFKVNERIIKGLDAYKSILKQYDNNKIENADMVALNYLKYMNNLNYRIKKLNYSYNFKVVDKKIYKRVIKSKIIKFKDKVILFIINFFPITTYNLKRIIKK